MKTPMQELLEWVRITLPMDLDYPRMIESKIELLLEKEKEHIIAAASFLPHDEQNEIKTPEEYYNENYKTK